MREARHTRNRERSVAATLLIALTVIAATAGMLWIVVSASRGVPWERHYDLQASFDDMAGLTELNELRMAGRRVGQVLNPRIERGRPVIDLQLDPDVEPLPADSRLVVRAKGLLGQRFLEIRRGRSKDGLREGDRIPASQTSSTVTTQDVLDAFEPRTRARLRALIGEFGVGLAARGRGLNRTIGPAGGLFGDLRATSDAVLNREGAARRFFPSLESAAGAAEPVREEIARGFEPQAAALQPFVVERPRFEETLVEAPPALRAIRTGLAATDPLLAQAQRFARATARTLAPAPAALEATRSLLAISGGPLRRTGALLRQIPPVARPLVAVERSLTLVLPRLRDALRDSIPGLRALGPRECDVLGWAANWRSMLGTGIPGGGPVGPLHSLRLELIASPESLGGNRSAPASGSLGRNPYPKPCEAGTEALP